MERHPKDAGACNTFFNINDAPVSKLGRAHGCGLRFYMLLRLELVRMRQLSM